MQIPVLIWYPACSTCKRAHAWLTAQGVPFDTRDIKSENPTVEEMAGWLELGGISLKNLFNVTGTLYRSMGLKDKLKDMSPEEQLELLASDGMLIKRPLLVTENKVLVGFKSAEWEAALLN